MVAFSMLAQQCAPAIALDLLVGLAAASSGFDASTVSFGGQRHSYSVGQAAAVIASAADGRHEAAVGLMGLSIATLLAHQIPLDQGLNHCKSLAAAQAAIKDVSASAKLRGVSPDHAVAVAFYVPGAAYTSPEGFVAAVEGARRQAKELATTDVKEASAVRDVRRNSEVPEASAWLAEPQNTVRVPQRLVREAWDVFGDYAFREPAAAENNEKPDDGVW